MNASKGGLVCQTLALANCSVSGGKKSRIRRSKEERKALVESFIKKYQKLNNGNFPSLNLTHKEVGGSFYTVREIVREVIQENRVLGPAKLTQEDESADTFLEQNPFGSISIDPEADLSSATKFHITTHCLLDHHHDPTEELVLKSSKQCFKPEDLRFDEGQTEENEEYDEVIYRELQSRERLELMQNGAELQAPKPKVTYVAADIMVETFPLKSRSKITYGLNESSSETGDSTEPSVLKEIEKVETVAGNSNSVLDRINFQESTYPLGNEEADVHFAGLLLEIKSPVLVDKKPVDNLEAPLLGNLNDATFKDVLDINDLTDHEIKHTLAGGIKLMDALDSILAQNLNGTVTQASLEQSCSEEATVTKSNPNIRHGGSSWKGSKLTLKRMNLESWKDISKESAEPKVNPFLTVFKTIVAAFEKFWSK